MNISSLVESCYIQSKTEKEAQTESANQVFNVATKSTENIIAKNSTENWLFMKK